MAAPSKKVEMWGRVVTLSQDLTQKQVADELGVHPETIRKWMKQEGYKWPHNGRKAARPGRHNPTEKVSKPCENCGSVMELNPSETARKYCSFECFKEGKRASFSCPCGKRVVVAKSIAAVRQFCSMACRDVYGKKRQPDPANYVTFNCQTCGDEVTRYRKYGSGANMFCSNPCAAKHTKTVRHYVIREMDMVLDSGWEALVAGLLQYHKVPVKRVDRSEAVTTESGAIYAPDFEVVVDGEVLYLEVKGFDNGNQSEGWETWRRERGHLVVLEREDLEAIMPSKAQVFGLLE